MSNFLKATALRDTVLMALSRMTTMAPTVWRDAGGTFRGALNDTITVRVPAFTVADDRALRSGANRNRRGLFESAVPVTLARNLYRDVPLTDEHQTLDIMNFARQVLNPMLEGIARGIESNLVSTVTGATYEHEVALDASDPFAGILSARKHLNDSNVPFSNRFLAVGSEVEEVILSQWKANELGESDVLREAQIGRRFGFNIVSVPALPPDEAYAYHQTAFALSTQAPIVPQGAPAGFTAAADGFAIRLVQVLDSATIENILSERRSNVRSVSGRPSKYIVRPTTLGSAPNRPCQRRTEHGSKTGSNPYRDQHFPVRFSKFKPLGKLIRDRPSHLHGGAFSSCRSAKKMGHQRPK
jgi:hypothetical protein